nr:hypothetical protein [Lysinibacillus timonensis]
MKSNLAKVILGATLTSMLLGVCLLLDGRNRVLAAGMHGHGPEGMFLKGGHPIMYEPHHGAFPWLGVVVFFIVGIAILVLFFKSLKKKDTTSSMEQFIQTNLVTSTSTLKSQKEDLLDQWEKDLMKKENR